MSEHYKKGEIEPIEYIIKNNLGFCEGNVVKYITRYKEKDDPFGDLMKAKRYIEYLLDQNIDNRHG